MEFVKSDTYYSDWYCVMGTPGVTNIITFHVLLVKSISVL